MSNINWLLLIASVGANLKAGDNLGTALFNAAVSHEQDAADFEQRSEPTYDERGEIKSKGVTLEDFFAPEGWVGDLARIANFDLTDYFSVDEFGHPQFNIEKLREAEASGVIDNIECDTTGDRVKIKVKAHDRMAALRMWRDHLGIEEAEEQPMKIEAIVTGVELDKGSQHWGQTKVTVQSVCDDFTATLRDTRFDAEFAVGDVVTVTITPFQQEQTNNA